MCFVLLNAPISLVLGLANPFAPNNILILQAQYCLPGASPL
jgi:hypothetical protein